MAKRNKAHTEDLTPAATLETEGEAPATENVTEDLTPATEDQVAPAKSPITRVYADTVLAIGPDSTLITRPKLKAIIDAFDAPEGEEGVQVQVAIPFAVEALKGSLKSRSFLEDPEAYLRGYLSTLIAANALTVLRSGTAPSPRAKKEEVEGEVEAEVVDA